MKYKCNLCNKDFSQKSNYDAHKNRKYSCVGLNDDIINSTNLPQNPTFLPQNPTFLPQNPTFLLPITNNENNKTNNELICNYCNKTYSRKDALTRHVNLYCKEKIKQDNGNQMMEQIVRDLMEQNREINEKIDLLTEENEELKQLSLCQISKVGKSKNISNIRNTNNKTNCNNDIINNTNTQNNILNDIHDNMITNNNNNQYLVNFGSKNISKLTDAEVLGSLKMLSNVLPHFVKTLHANKH